MGEACAGELGGGVAMLGGWGWSSIGISPYCVFGCRSVGQQCGVRVSWLLGKVVLGDGFGGGNACYIVVGLCGRGVL